MRAHVELSYRRLEDGQPVTLAADLPVVRAVEIGGSPEGLRLPGTAANATYCTISQERDEFIVRAAARPEGGGNTLMLVNGEPLRDEPHSLGDGDVLKIRINAEEPVRTRADRGRTAAGGSAELASTGEGETLGPESPPVGLDFELTFHEGELGEDDRLLDTHQRWKQRVPEGVRQEGDEEPKDESTAYIKEFELGIRPLMNAEQHDEVERRADQELLRLVRSDEADTLERYVRFLWSLRVAALARGEKQKEAEDLCQHAIDLFPRDAGLLAWLGTAQLRNHEWKAAAATFTRALRVSQRSDLRVLQFARVGRVLARDELATDAAGESGYRHPVTPHSDEWQTPPLDLDAPGDELLYFHLLRSCRLFGDENGIQFRFRGQKRDAADETRNVQRWEILDRSTGRLYRRVIRVPTPGYADPSLVVESALLRHHLSQADPNWLGTVVDLSEDENVGRKSPVTFDPTVIEVLTKSVTSATPYVRLVTEKQDDALTFDINFVAAPNADDLVYEQGMLKVAVAEKAVELLAGSRLSWRKDSDGEGYCLESPNFPRVCLMRRPPAAPKVADREKLQIRLLIAIVILLGANLVLLLIQMLRSGQ